MDKITAFLAEIPNILDQVISSFQTFTGITPRYAPLVFWLIISYLLLFLLILPLHKQLKKKKSWLQQQLVAQVDEMIYLLAKAQHLKKLDLKALGGNPHIALMKSIFTKGNYDYLQSAFLILDNMHKVETLLGEKVVPQEKEADFLKGIKRYQRISFFEAFLKMLLMIGTLGSYTLRG